MTAFKKEDKESKDEYTDDPGHSRFLISKVCVRQPYLCIMFYTGKLKVGIETLNAMSRQIYVTCYATLLFHHERSESLSPQKVSESVRVVHCYSRQRPL